MLAAFVALVTWFGHQIFDFFQPPADIITLPSFVGQTVSDADAQSHRMHLTATVIDHATSDRYPKGVVMAQRPDAGTKVRQGRQIGFVVSDGLVTRLMPDLRYQSMREVGLDLERSHLQLGNVRYEKSDIVPAGHVISQDPQPISNVLEGDKVDVVVSKGGQQTIRVPNFVGMPIDAARAEASKLGITLGQLVWTPLGRNGPAHGIVARQNVAAGAKINAYDPVSLQVSAGPNESGYLLRQVHILASVPVPETSTPGQAVKVTLRVTDATGAYDAYKAYAQPGQKMDFVISALGTSVVDMYVNDVLVGETRLGDEPKNVYRIAPKKGAAQAPSRHP